MFPTNLFFSLFALFALFLSAAALDPASENQDTNNPSPAHHDAERDLVLAQNLHNTTDAPLPSSILNTTTNAIQTTCFRPDTHSSRIHPIDCHTVLYNMLTNPDALTPLRYDRTSDLPVENSSQTCSVILTRAAARSDDVFPPVLVAHAAALVVKECVTVAYGFQGGYARIGSREGFLVYVSASGNGNGNVVPSATA